MQVACRGNQSTKPAEAELQVCAVDRSRIPVAVKLVQIRVKVRTDTDSGTLALYLDKTRNH